MQSNFVDHHDREDSLIQFSTSCCMLGIQKIEISALIIAVLTAHSDILQFSTSGLY